MSLCRVIAGYSGIMSSRLTAIEMDIENPTNITFREQRSIAEILAFHGDISVGWISGISVYHDGGIKQYSLNYLSYTSDLLPGNGIESIIIGSNGKFYINASGSTGGGLTQQQIMAIGSLKI